MPSWPGAPEALLSASPISFGPHLLFCRLQLAPLGAQHLGDLRKGQVRVASANLLPPLVQKANIARDGRLGPIGENLLSLLALGPASLLHRLREGAVYLGGAWDTWAWPWVVWAGSSSGTGLQVKGQNSGESQEGVLGRY